MLRGSPCGGPGPRCAAGVRSDGAPVVCAATHLEEYVENVRRVQCHAARFTVQRDRSRRMPCMNTSSDIQADVRTSDPTGLHRVLDDGAVLPQAATRLDTRADLWPDEVRIRVER